MWGQIFLEASIQQNFNFGFSTHKSDILVHLSQWQYWWWFWFSLVWVVYYFVIITDATKRSLAFNPILNTSLRSHGKWGDFLVALIPLSWCGNILVNSNFILRIIEWQNESSLFTLRIQGKQWYWVYKYDGNAAIMIDSAPKNIGNDRWFTTIANESYCSDSYYQALHLAAQLEFQEMYNIELKKAEISKKKMEATTLYTNPTYTPEITKLSDEKFYEDILNINYYCNSIKYDMITVDQNLDNNVEQSLDNNVEENLNNKNNLSESTTINSESTIINSEYPEINSEYSEIISELIGTSQSEELLSTPEENQKKINHYSSTSEDELTVNIKNTPDSPQIEQVKEIYNNVDSYPYNERYHTYILAQIEYLKANMPVERLIASYVVAFNRLPTEEEYDTTYAKPRCYVINKSVLRAYETLFTTNTNIIDFYNNNIQLQHYDLIKIDDTQNTQGNMRILLSNTPIVLHAGILNDHVIEVLKSTVSVKTPLLFTATINNNLLEPKINQTEDLWGFRQKRYKRLKEFKFSPKIVYDPNTFQPIPNDSLIKTYNLILNHQRDENVETGVTPSEYVGNLSYRATVDQSYSPTTLEIQKTQVANTNNAYYFYSSLKLNKKRSEVLSVNLARRLLRTKRTLVLPVHVNITVITNSYDVVHSWFIPGLGLKLDCVPGRSTHHTLYVDNVGFYYGQCAEICGRYHHHMPIRVCAIPFEQFLVWWHTKGLPRTLRLHSNKLMLHKAENKIILHKAIIQYRYNF